MPDIQKLTSEVQQLQDSFGWWTNAVLWLTAVTALVAFGYFVASRIALAKGERLRVRQEQLANVKEGRVASDLKEKDKQIEQIKAQAEKDKEESAEKIADANARASEAGARAAEAQRVAAEATLFAERERMARLQLEVRLADRTLSPTQQAAITGRLKTAAGIVVDVLVWGDTPEIAIISNQVLDSIQKAGWTVNLGHAGGVGSAVRGILIGTRVDADANTARASSELIAALRSAGLACGPWDFATMQEPAITFNTSFTGTAPIRIFIGSKP